VEQIPVFQGLRLHYMHDREKRPRKSGGAAPRSGERSAVPAGVLPVEYSYPADTVNDRIPDLSPLRVRRRKGIKGTIACSKGGQEGKPWKRRKSWIS
jgi:hypothetical protein